MSNIEGDPDHVINRGALCSKGAALSQLAENKNRLTEPMYRAPNSKEWKKVSWEWALAEITKRIKATREAAFTLKNEKGQTVAKKRLGEIKKISPAAKLLDADDVRVIYLVAYKPELYHKFAVASVFDFGITRQMALAKMFRPVKNIASGLV